MIPKDSTIDYGQVSFQCRDENEGKQEVTAVTATSLQESVEWRM